MSCTMISFDKGRNQFSFGSDDCTWSDLGVKIAQALSEGKELIDFGCVRVTVGYLTGMMRFARKHGWFWDNFDIGTGDHNFDVNVATPGARFKEMRELRRYAAQCRENAHKASCAYAYADVEYWQTEARNADEQVRKYLASGGIEE